MSETDNVVSLAVLKDQNFVYGLANGTVGVYEQYERRWRVKSKSKPLALLGFDVNGDGEPEILCGWASGKVRHNIETKKICKKFVKNSNFFAVWNQGSV
jgi:Bardet-Biedl syndrome 2 protein